MNDSPKTAANVGRISVVMVSYMTGPALLESIKAVQADPDIDELIIVDNGNHADARTLFFEAAQRTDKVRILQGHGNVGFAKGCNYGAAMASGDYLYFLNPDAVTETGAARKLADALSDWPAPCLAGGLLLSSTGDEQRGARRGALTAASAFASFTPLHRLPGIRSIHRDDEPLPEAPVPMPTVSGASIMMERQTFDQLGGFDEGYFLHVEDIAICRAIRAAGGTVIFVPGARALHHGSTSNVPRWRVEWHKLKGFIRYFWTAGPGVRVKLGTVLGAPLMAAALFGRLAVFSLRKVLQRR